MCPEDTRLQRNVLTREGGGVSRKLFGGSPNSLRRLPDLYRGPLALHSAQVFLFWPELLFICVSGAFDDDLTRLLGDYVRGVGSAETAVL